MSRSTWSCAAAAPRRAATSASGSASSIGVRSARRKPFGRSSRRSRSSTSPRPIRRRRPTGRSRTRGPASSRRSRSTTSSGSSTARCSRRSRASAVSRKDGIEGTIRVLPWEPLVKDGQPPRFHTDLIVIDNFTHLLGCWGLDYLSEGDVVFPLSMDELEIYGDRPPRAPTSRAGSRSSRSSGTACASKPEIVRPDGTVWMRIRDWEDWRFHWPGRYRDVIRQPRDFWLGEELPLDRLRRTARSPRPRPSGSSLRPTWAGRSGATCWSRSARARRASRAAGFGRATSGGEPTGSGAGSPPRRPPGGSGRPPGSPPIYPADLAHRGRRARPARALLAGEPGRFRRRGHLDRPLRRRRRRARRRRSRAPGWESTSSRSPSGPRASRRRRSPAREQLLLIDWSGCEPSRVGRAVLVRQGSRGQGDRAWARPAGPVDCEIAQVDEAYGRHAV